MGPLVCPEMTYKLKTVILKKEESSRGRPAGFRLEGDLFLHLFPHGNTRGLANMDYCSALFTNLLRKYFLSEQSFHSRQ